MQGAGCSAVDQCSAFTMVGEALQHSRGRDSLAPSSTSTNQRLTAVQAEGQQQAAQMTGSVLWAAAAAAAAAAAWCLQMMSAALHCCIPHGWRQQHLAAGQHTLCSRSPLWLQQMLRHTRLVCMWGPAPGPCMPVESAASSCDMLWLWCLPPFCLSYACVRLSCACVGVPAADGDQGGG